MSSFTLSVVFMLWFNVILGLIFFLLFQIHYHILPYPETKENNTCTRDKIELKHIHVHVETFLKGNVNLSIMLMI